VKMDFRNIDKEDLLKFSDRRGGETHIETVEFCGFTDDGLPVVRFADGTRRMVLAEQLSPLEGGGPHTFTIQGHEAIEKIVKAQGTSGRVYVPVDWVGKRVMIIRLDDD